MAMPLRTIIATLMPIPALAPVLSPLLAGVVASSAVDTLVSVFVLLEVEPEWVGSFVAASS